MVEDRPMSVKYSPSLSLLLLAKTITHPAARSLRELSILFSIGVTPTAKTPFALRKATSLVTLVPPLNLHELEVGSH